MTVKEFIKKIETFPDDMEVMTASQGRPHEMKAIYVIKNAIDDTKHLLIV